MATITFTISPTDLQRLVDATCAQNGYQDILEDGTPNPESKQEFTKRTWREKMAGLVRTVEADIQRSNYEKNNPIINPNIV